MSMPEASWRPDPTGRHEYRYWDGTAWSEAVADQGVETMDPLSEALPPPEPDAPDVAAAAPVDPPAGASVFAATDPPADPPPVAGGHTPADPGTPAAPPTRAAATPAPDRRSRGRVSPRVVVPLVLVVAVLAGVVVGVLLNRDGDDGPTAAGTPPAGDTSTTTAATADGMVPDAAAGLTHVVVAICDEGPDVAEHGEAVDQHRQANPELWAAIGAVLPEADPGDPECATRLTLTAGDVEALRQAIPSRSAGSDWPTLETALDHVASATAATAGGETGGEVLPYGRVVAVAQLADAVCDEGSLLAEHTDIMDEHRQANPELWAAIDALLPNGDPGAANCAAGIRLGGSELGALTDAIPDEAAGPDWPALDAALTALAGA